MAQATDTRKETASSKGVSHGSAASRVYKKFLPNIQKRDGRIVPFEFDKIVRAIEKAMKA